MSAGSIRERFRLWRKGRPFWAGVLLLLGAVATAGAPLGPVSAMIAAGPAAVSGVAFGTIYAGAAMVIWFAAAQRVFVAFVCAVLAVASFALSNFGGLGVGMLCTLLGASMAFGWQDGSKPTRKQLRALRRAAARTTGPAAAVLVAAMVATAVLPVVTADPAQARTDQRKAVPRAQGVAPARLPQQDSSSVTVGTMDATNLRVRGTTVLQTATGSRQVLVLHADEVTLDDYALRSDQAGPAATISFDMTVRDVDLYVQTLSGLVTLPPLPPIPVVLDAEFVPTFLPIDITVPAFRATGVSLQQTLVVAPRAEVTGLRLGVG